MKIDQMEDEIHENINAAIVEMEHLRAENARLLARCERYEGALRHYADEQHWCSSHTYDKHWRDSYLADWDGTAVAREALAGEEGRNS